MQSKPIKKIFVCEFITGGGLNHINLPASLVNEGLLMRDALLKDLASLQYEIFITIDARLTSSAVKSNVQYIHVNQDVWLMWDALISQVDAVWLIAPETDGFLQKLTNLALRHQKKIIGCGLTTIDICCSKLSTSNFFKQYHIDTIDTFMKTNWDKTVSTKWVVKPDDGAGCEDTILFEDTDILMRWLADNDEVKNHVIQPFIEGVAASISCVMHKGRAEVLSCNKQLISLENNHFSYQGFVVNGMREYWALFTYLANKVAKVLPDASGYVGIDVMVTQTESEVPEIKLIEVNPRLTTTYVGLAQATGLNPAKFIIDMVLEEESLKSTLIERNEVMLKVTHA